MKKFIHEFRDFILRGNVMQLAFAVTVGAAFGLIVSSLVNDIIMPLISLIIGSDPFNELAWKVNDKVTINYGIFIQNIVNFLIIALSIFIFIKIVSKLLRQSEAQKTPSAAVPTAEEKLLTEIRDLLREKAADTGDQHKEEPV